jgi:cell division protein ZapA (FtsZ GTPase activity inhibitor)
MTLTEQVAQLRELARLSSGTRMLDVLIINILDELAQAVGRLERNEPQGQTRSRQRSGDGTSPTIDPQ